MYGMGRSLHDIDLGSKISYMAHVIDMWIRREYKHLVHGCAMVPFERVPSRHIWLCVWHVLLEYFKLFDERSELVMGIVSVRYRHHVER